MTQEMNPKVDFYFNKEKKWPDEIIMLRNIALSCGLTEDLKWGCPCYTLGKANVVLIHTFKEYCAVLFFKGALLQDPQGLLVQQTENVQAARQMRFTSTGNVAEQADTLKRYIAAAVQVEKSGQKVELKKSTELVYPEEFKSYLDQMPELQQAFDALTPGRRRAYNLYFSAAKQSKTRQERVQKCIPKIMSGKGLED